MNKVFRRKFYGYIILLLTILFLCPLAASAEDADNYCGDQLTWTLENGTLTIQGTGNMYNYARYGNRAPWRDQSASITNVRVLSGVTSVGTYAFCGCTKLTSAVLADSVTNMGDYVFQGCSVLKSVTLPSRITFIPQYAFQLCKELMEIQIPNSITSIGSSAFEYCDSLTSVIIPDSVNNLGQYAFYACDNLTTASLGIGVNGLNYSVFAGCNKLQSVNVAEDNPHIASLNGVVYSKQIDELLFHPAANGRTLTIPNSVLVIREKPFMENSSGLAGHDSMLKVIYFEGNAPDFEKDCFTDITATAYYPQSDSTWSSATSSSYGGNITWLPYDSETNRISLRESEIQLAYETTPWTGNPCYPAVTVTYQGTTLIEGVHYMVDYTNVKNVGTGTVTITGIGSYMDSVDKYFTISKAEQTLDLSISNSTLEVGNTANITAIGSRGLLYITFVSDHPDVASVEADGKVTAIAPGNATITVTSAGNEKYLPLSKTLSIMVIPVVEGVYDINQCQISMLSANQTYTGSPMKAVFSVKRGSNYLVENKDYTVTCSDCTDVGTATAVVTGIGNYTGRASYHYEILPAGQTIKASVSPETIKIGEQAQITANGIGTITYRSENPDVATVDQNGLVTGIAVGRAMVEIRASGDRNHNTVSCFVSIKVEAEENPELISISTCNVSLITTEYIYDGTEKCPEAKVMNGNTLLLVGKDYIITYHNNVNAGYPTATVVGKGDYTGSSAPLTYHIRKAFQTVHISTLSPLIIRVGESAQIEATGIGRLSYFTSTANNSLEIGQYTGVVTGLTKGSVEVNVHASGDDNHMPGDAAISVQVTAAESSTEPTTSATEPTEPSTEPTTSTTEPTKPSTEPTTSTTEPTKPSTEPTTSATEPTKPSTQPTMSATQATKPSTSTTTAIKISSVSKLSVSNVARRKMVVKWKKNTKATGYQIQYSKSKKFVSGNKTVNISNASTVKKTISSLTKKKTYYVRIRTYKKISSGKKYYSSWSKAKAVKIKK